MRAGLVVLALLLSGCASGGVARPLGPLRVVAVENVWGSLAAQVGGPGVAVTDLISSPSADPHSYEPTAEDGRLVAQADLVIVNGIGYDGWARKLVDASPSPRRVVLDVGQVLGASAGSNPHRWYDPTAVRTVIAVLAADLARLDPAQAGGFARRRASLEGTGLARYASVIAAIRGRFAGVAVGASESIVAMLTPALGLALQTPPGWLTAISEGTDPTSADKVTADRQIAQHLIKVYLYNPQNATPDVQAQVAAARRAGIPVVAFSETLTPAGASFQDWQTRQLEALQAALASASGR